MLRGVISALAWNPVDETLLRSLYAGDAVQKVAALRASALRGDAVADWHTHAHSDSPWVRAAACRAASAEHIGWLDEFASDTDLCVRAESVLAWKRLAAPSDLTSPLAVQASSRLWQCVSAQLQVLGNSSGWNRIQAQRRLARWIRHLARLAPLGHPGIPQLLDRLPPRIALDFLLHHGDADLMPALLTLMRLPDHAQWGGWVWYCLTGVDLRSQGLALKDQVGSAEDVTAPQTNPSDIGLPFPDVDAIARHPASQIRLPEGERLLQGYALHPKRLRSLLDPSSNQPQTLRAFAAEALGDLYPEYTLNLRARQDEQDEVLARMGVAV